MTISFNVTSCDDGNQYTCFVSGQSCNNMGSLETDNCEYHREREREWGKEREREREIEREIERDTDRQTDRQSPARCGHSYQRAAPVLVKISVKVIHEVKHAW